MAGSWSRRDTTKLNLLRENSVVKSRRLCQVASHCFRFAARTEDARSKT